MNKLFIAVFLVVPYFLFSQDTGNFLMGSHLDLIKSDHDGYFQKVQVGLEVNYFLSKKFTGTFGVEFWTRDGASAVVGTRWYPSTDAFVRVRGLLGGNDDVSIGGGWAKPLSETLRFESMADFYFEGNFSIRAGLAYLIRQRK
jgi:hypothetical protein